MPNLMILREDIDAAINRGTLRKEDEPFMIQMLAKLDRGLAPLNDELRRIATILADD